MSSTLSLLSSLSVPVPLRAVLETCFIKSLNLKELKFLEIWSKMNLSVSSTIFLLSFLNVPEPLRPSRQIWPDWAVICRFNPGVDYIYTPEANLFFFPFFKEGKKKGGINWIFARISGWEVKYITSALCTSCTCNMYMTHVITYVRSQKKDN